MAPPPSDSMRLRQVGKRYGRGPYVLGQVDVALSAGDVIHVKGGNGSGKSTLLRIIAGVSAPTRGSVAGRPASVGFVPERFPPAVRFTPYDYLRHLAAIRRTSATAAIDLLDRLGGGGYVDTPMMELSKGSCQKVALAQALAAPPGLLVLDEAWTGLDTAAQAVLTTVVEQQAAGGAIVVLTDHANRTTALRATARWSVVEGRLSESAADRVGPCAIVTLAGRGKDLRAVPGIVATWQQEDRVVLEVLPEDCDAVLAAALRSGWSVHEVRPPL